MHLKCVEAKIVGDLLHLKIEVRKKKTDRKPLAILGVMIDKNCPKEVVMAHVKHHAERLMEILEQKEELTEKPFEEMEV